MTQTKRRRCPLCGPGSSLLPLSTIKRHMPKAHGLTWKQYEAKRKEQNQRRAFIKRHFNGSPVELHDGAYLIFWITQRGLCALNPEHSGRPLSLDHDHITGDIRGLLCRGCNTGLGQLGDTIEDLKRALAYLERTT